jgi:flagellar hook-basal body complex protein FliE
VMISGQKAAMALTFGIQMRNKMVSAYQEIMNMAV